MTSSKHFLTLERLTEILDDLPTSQPLAGGWWLDGGIVTKSAATPPTIATQPGSLSVEEGATATFSVVADNATSYQWQLDSGSGFADIIGATSSSYTTGVLVLAQDGDEYRVIITGPGGSVTSSVAVLSISEPFGVSDFDQLVAGSTEPTLAGVLADERDGLGDSRTRQPGRCFEFDGVDDYVDCGDASELTFGDGVSDSGFTISLWVKAANGTPIAKAASSNSGEWYLFKNGGSWFFRLIDESANAFIGRSFTVVSSDWINLVCVYDGSGVSSGITVYVNGATQNTVDASTGSGGYVAMENTANSVVLGNRGGAQHYSGSLSGVQVFDSALSSLQAAAIFANTFTGSAVAQYKCDEGAGTTAYDSSGNGNHGTITNATTAGNVFHAIDDSVPYSWQNEVGYSESGGGVLIPRDESTPTLDVLGNALQYSGVAPNPGQAVDSPCLTFDGLDDYLSASHLTGSETVTSSGGTSTPTISAGRIDFTAGTCWDLQISDGTRYAMSERSGATVHDVSGNGNHGTINNATTSPAGSGAWVNTQDQFHWALAKGFRADSGVEIPSLTDSTAAADGNAITNPAIVGHNGGVTKLSLHDGEWSFNDARTNPHFRRQITSGGTPIAADRFLSAKDTLTGSDLTTIQNYTADQGD